MPNPKDYTKLLDNRRVLFDVRLTGECVTYINCTGERANQLLLAFGSKNVAITPKVAR